MQVAVLVPEHEWRQLVADVQRLKEVEATTPPTPPPAPDRLLTVRQAAAYLLLTPAGLRKARRAGRLSGVKLNEKEWGFRESELNRYLDRYNRRTAVANRKAALLDRQLPLSQHTIRGPLAQAA